MMISTQANIIVRIKTTRLLHLIYFAITKCFLRFSLYLDDDIYNMYSYWFLHDVKSDKDNDAMDKMKMMIEKKQMVTQCDLIYCF